MSFYNFAAIFYLVRYKPLIVINLRDKKLTLMIISFFNLLKVNINNIAKLTEHVAAFFLNSNSIR